MSGNSHATSPKLGSLLRTQNGGTEVQAQPFQINDPRTIIEGSKLRTRGYYSKSDSDFPFPATFFIATFFLQPHSLSG